MTLKIPAPTLTALRDALIQDDDLERFAYLTCSQSGQNLLAPEFEPVADDNLAVMERGACRPDSDVERAHLAACYADGKTPIMVHSHPFNERPGFSGIDVGTMDDYRDWLTGLYPEEDFGFAVIGSTGLQTTIYDAKADCFTPLPVNVLGEWVLEDEWMVPSERSEIDIDTQRYDRNIRALTKAGQHRLADTHVAVVGCGGIGSLLSEELARLGVQHFTLVDPDVVEESNLPRLYGAYEYHIGRAKVEAVAEHLWHINPDLDMVTYQKPVEAVADELVDVDVVLAGVDRVSARSFLNEFAVKHLIPYIDAGVVIEKDEHEVTAMHGFVHTIVPGVNGCFDCLDRGDPEQERLEQMSEGEFEEQVERGYVDETAFTPEPAVIHLNSTVASIAVSEFAKLVTGFAAPADFLRYEALEHEMVAMTTRPSEACITCGEMLGRGTVEFEDEDAAEHVEDALSQA